MREMSLRQFALHLDVLARTTPVRQAAGLKAAATILRDEARSLPGAYQGPAGPFGRWPDLKDSTIRDRIAKGYPGNEPLLREGEVRDSFHSRSDANEAVVGSDNDKAVWIELGTKAMAPRPIAGMALARKKEEAIGAVVAAVMGPVRGD